MSFEVLFRCFSLNMILIQVTPIKDISKYTSEKTEHEVIEGIRSIFHHKFIPSEIVQQLKLV